ncbi:MAG: hypothetical protein ACFFC7_14065, partial [Candidatus Hermodarchaeota archaeon]
TLVVSVPFLVASIFPLFLKGSTDPFISLISSPFLIFILFFIVFFVYVIIQRKLNLEFLIRVEKRLITRAFYQFCNYVISEEAS